MAMVRVMQRGTVGRSNGRPAPSQRAMASNAIFADIAATESDSPLVGIPFQTLASTSSSNAPRGVAPLARSSAYMRQASRPFAFFGSYFAPFFSGAHADRPEAPVGNAGRVPQAEPTVFGLSAQYVSTMAAASVGLAVALLGFRLFSR